MLTNGKCSLQLKSHSCGGIYVVARKLRQKWERDTEEKLSTVGKKNHFNKKFI